jgi:hypothetical protein
MPSTDKTIERVVYGSIEAIAAEYSLPDMGEDWFKRWGFRYAVKILAEGEYDAEFHKNAKEARADAKALAKQLGVPFSFVA